MSDSGPSASAPTATGTSATDIITYIGVPLAVLGVLPILYNTFVTLVNASRIRRMLRHSRQTALMTRSDVVNRVIEIELPRYAVTPWDRFLHRRDYWEVSPAPSTIPGGSWTTLNWKTSTIGVKTQRVEYADQLRQPQVEVRFDELVAYLLDLGGVPDAHGWRLLRSTGLWTPVGCTLMRSPDGTQAALAIAPLDDSDGNLSLSVAWRPEWTSRSFADLPPYWVSLPAPPGGSSSEKSTEAEAEAEASSQPDTKEGHGTKHDRTHSLTPITCQISVDGIVTALTEEKRRGGGGTMTGIARNNTMGAASTAPGATMTSVAATVNIDSLYIEHIRVRRSAGSSSGSSSTDGMWFASAATAYGTTSPTSQTILWNYRIPDDVVAFARRETVPCGVLVLLGACCEDETPAWATTQHAHHEGMQQLQKYSQRSAEERLAVQAEMRLPPNQRAAAQRARTQRVDLQRLADMRAQSQRAQERREQREREALSSPKWDTRLVAEHALRWLRANGRLQHDKAQQEDTKVTTEKTRLAAGHILHRMVRDSQFSSQLCRMLDRWKTWADLGGMKQADLQALREQTETFCQATLLMALITGTATVHDGTLSADLQECIRMWHKVRLG